VVQAGGLPCRRYLPLRLLREPLQVELGPIRKASDVTPKRPGSAPGLSPLSGGAVAAIARAKAAGTPQSGGKPRPVLREANAH
jgi:hypothetical protein